MRSWLRHWWRLLSGAELEDLELRYLRACAVREVVLAAYLARHEESRKLVDALLKASRQPR